MDLGAVHITKAYKEISKHQEDSIAVSVKAWGIFPRGKVAHLLTFSPSGDDHTRIHPLFAYVAHAHEGRITNEEFRRWVRDLPLRHYSPMAVAPEQREEAERLARAVEATIDIIPLTAAPPKPVSAWEAAAREQQIAREHAAEAVTPPKPAKFEPDAIIKEVPPLVPAVKEPWQMTVKDFNNNIGAYRNYLSKQHPGRLTLEQWETLYRPNVPLGAKPETWALQNRTDHKASVRMALDQGHSVSAEVLRDYPELAAKVTPPPVKEPSITEKWRSNPLVKSWLEQGWDVVVAPDKSRIAQLQREGYEPSSALVGVWVRKTKPASQPQPPEKKREQLRANLETEASNLTHQISAEIGSYAPIGKMSELGEVLGVQPPKKGETVSTPFGTYIFAKSRMPDPDTVKRWRQQYDKAHELRKQAAEYGFMVVGPHLTTGNILALEHGKRLAEQGLLSNRELAYVKQLEDFWRKYPTAKYGVVQPDGTISPPSETPPIPTAKPSPIVAAEGGPLAQFIREMDRLLPRDEAGGLLEKALQPKAKSQAVARIVQAHDDKVITLSEAGEWLDDVLPERSLTSDDDVLAFIEYYHGQYKPGARISPPKALPDEEIDRLVAEVTRRQQAARTAMQTGMGIGEKAPQGELLPEYGAGTTAGKVPLADVEAMKAKAARGAQIAKGQAEMAVPTPPLKTVSQMAREVIECDRAHTLDDLRVRAKAAGLSLSGDKKSLCTKLIQVGLLK